MSLILSQVGSLLNDLEAKPSEKGFSMERLTALRAAIRPAYRQPLRWGMKNPHSTYILGLLLRYFPCLACALRARLRAGLGAGVGAGAGAELGSQASLHPYQVRTHAAQPA